MPPIKTCSHALIGLTFMMTLTTACGDPCLDDGLGKPGAVCAANDGADEQSDETADTDDTDDADETAEGAEAEAEAEAGNEQTFCTDADGDGFGDPDDCQTVPEGEPQPPGTVPEEQATDCDDSDPNTYPGAAPNDDPDACMTDADGDGWGDATPSSPGATPGSDCDDQNPHAFPGAAPNDDPDACMQDEDGDGYGDMWPSGPNTVPGSDCDDANPAVFGCEIWCEDADDDGFGNPRECTTVPEGEDPPPGYVQDDSDCLDSDPNAYPGAAELEDPDACMLDADGDGWGDPNPPAGVVAGNDCDDADPDAVVCVNAVPTCVDTGLGIGTQLMAEAVGGDGNYSFSWTPVETLDDPTLADPIATPTAITTYTVTVTDGLGNVGSDELTVHLTDQPWVLGGDNAECSAVGFLGAPAAHSFSPDGTITCTTSNSDPTAYICPIVHEQARITGTMVVNTAADDDIIGFVWGWQSADQFYLLSWKQAFQNWFGCAGEAGITVKRVDRQQPYATNDFACGFDTPNVTVLMGPEDTTTQGWIDFREYGVELLYDHSQTEITVTDLSDDSVVANFVVLDDSYPSGQFGTYDFSQDQACNGPWQSSCL